MAWLPLKQSTPSSAMSRFSETNGGAHVLRWWSCQVPNGHSGGLCHPLLLPGCTHEKPNTQWSLLLASLGWRKPLPSSEPTFLIWSPPPVCDSLVHIITTRQSRNCNDHSCGCWIFPLMEPSMMLSHLFCKTHAGGASRHFQQKSRPL